MDVAAKAKKRLRARERVPHEPTLLRARILEGPRAARSQRSRLTGRSGGGAQFELFTLQAHTQAYRYSATLPAARGQTFSKSDYPYNKDRYGEIGFGLPELNQSIGSLLIVTEDIFEGRKSRG